MLAFMGVGPPIHVFMMKTPETSPSPGHQYRCEIETPIAHLLRIFWNRNRVCNKLTDQIHLCIVIDHQSCSQHTILHIESRKSVLSHITAYYDLCFTRLVSKHIDREVKLI